jgi:hypothetical protein
VFVLFQLVKLLKFIGFVRFQSTYVWLMCVVLADFDRVGLEIG